MKKIFYSTLLTLTVILGFSFASADASFADLAFMSILEEGNGINSNKTTNTEDTELSQHMIDSINARLNAKNLEVKNQYNKKEEESKTSYSSDEPVNIRTGMRSARIHKTDAETLHGVASYYHDKFVGRKTANGEIFSQVKYTCACNSLPLGTYLRVTNKKNGKQVVVKVNDRLAKYNKRVVDLSKCSARKIGSIQDGLAKVKVEVISASEAKKIIASY